MYQMRYSVIPLWLHVPNEITSHPAVTTCTKWDTVSSHWATCTKWDNLSYHCDYMYQMKYSLIPLWLHIPREIPSHPTVTTCTKWNTLSSHCDYIYQMRYRFIPLWVHVPNEIPSHLTVTTCTKWDTLSSNCDYSTCTKWISNKISLWLCVPSK